MKRTLSRMALGALAVAFLTATPALAQDEEVEIRSDRVVIELDEDGRIVVDGRTLTEGDEPIILRVDPDDGEIEVETVGPRRHVVVRKGPGPRGDRVLYRHRDDDGKQYMRDFDFDFDFEMPDIPDIAPLLEGLRFEIEPFRESFEEHREVAALERESRELARSAREAEGDERRLLESELRTHLNEIFDRKLQIRRERIAELEERVSEERNQVESRRTARDEIVDRRLRALMGEDDLLDW